MGILGKFVAGVSAFTVFSGTAYVSAVTLAPPPSYTVTDRQRLESYELLSENAEYEKKTKTQEFYLGLTRWRKKLLREEGELHGRVLEVGAGCGGNIPYYPQIQVMDDEITKNFLHQFLNGSKVDKGESSRLLSKLKKNPLCDEIVLCDRTPGMVDVCSKKIQERFGYTPYRYPDYDLERIQREAKNSSNEKHPSSGTLKRKVIHEDGKTKEIITIPLSENFDDTSAIKLKGTEKFVAPIVNKYVQGDRLPLLSPEGSEFLQDREKEIDSRRQFRLTLIDLLEGKINNMDNYKQKVADMIKNHTNERLKLFSVANYAVEQLPFASNSFDTIVDTFGLCSYDDPVRALREMSRVCKPDGKILLLEHGKGKATRINSYLDKWAPRHAVKWGCWWNRDIRRIIRLSGLKVDKWEEKHFGTSQYIVAKPFKTLEELESLETQRK